MPDILAANVTYTEVAGKRRLVGRPPHFENIVDVVFGNNSLNYPTGGVPLSANKLGMPSGVVEEIVVLDQGANAKGFKVEPDLTNLKLKFMVEDTVGVDTPLAEHTNATFVPNPATVRLRVIGF